MAVKTIRKVIPLTFWLMAASTAFSAEGPVFPIAGFSVDGNSVLSQSEIDGTLSPYIGTDQQFSDIEAARIALQQAYIDRGLSTVKVYLPEQEISGGIVQFQIEENRLGRVSVVGAKHHDASNVRQSAPQLQEGELPNVVELAESLRLANRNPSKTTYILFRPLESSNEIEALLRVDDRPARKRFITVDNSGSPTTGRTRLALGFQDANLFNSDHVLTLQAILSPEQIDDVAVLGLGYRIPFYRNQSTLDLFAGYSEVDSGTIASVFEVSGAGTVLGGRYTQYFQRAGAYEQYLAVGWEYRDYDSDVDFFGAEIGADVTVSPLSLTYGGDWQSEDSLLNFSIGVHANLPGLGSDHDDFDLARAGARESYWLSRAALTYSRTFAEEWQFTWNLQGQYSDGPLVPGEQFMLGGVDTVRGFEENIVAGDRALLSRMELLGPDLGGKTELANDFWRFLVFVDSGAVRRNEALPGESQGSDLLSVGAGVRYGLTERLSLNIDYGWIVDEQNTGESSGDGRLHGRLSYLF
ncbi:ShlB/FhaC/HecB family hemolysin secretion/activation protein [Marinobacterium litorale]|uniref:ShlB/FhaC/HecB family hemolysin secretion/activation protein n=1 Tax=Marinobacterium litorale TaxID=404770 RepID=UPI000410191B|nr:ShlB/FhaC/HecB family hemolysin secretion/activation protein [Marinobacterium litorale]